MPDFKGEFSPFDGIGFLLFGGGLVSFSAGLELFGNEVEPHYLVPVFIVFSLFLLLLYVRHALHARTPLIPLTVFRTRTFSVGIAGNLVSRLGMGCVPFLIPLMLQVGLGFSALTAGMAMMPMAIGSITAKTFVMRILNRLGYRSTLLTITISIGILIALFALQSPSVPLPLLFLPLFLLGVVMSTQFTSMNSITLGDLTEKTASTGNSLLSITQQLSISFGVASSTAILRLYTQYMPGTLLDHFHYTFITIGAITMMAAFVFVRLRPDDGSHLLSHRYARKNASAQK